MIGGYDGIILLQMTQLASGRAGLLYYDFDTVLIPLVIIQMNQTNQTLLRRQI